MYLHRHGNKYRLSCHGVPCSLPLLDWRENESQNQQCDYCTRHSLHNNPEKMQNTKQLNIAVIWEMIAFTIVLQFRHNGSIYFIYFLSFAIVWSKNWCDLLQPIRESYDCLLGKSGAKSRSITIIMASVVFPVFTTGNGWGLEKAGLRIGEKGVREGIVLHSSPESKEYRNTSLRTIHCTEKDGNWFTYPYFLAHENSNNTRKNAQKSSKNVKTSRHVVVDTEKLCKNDCLHA